MREASKAALRRRKEDFEWENVFTGRGLDIGCGDDPCNRIDPWKITSLETFDLARGDANFVRQHFPDECFDFIHASHLLEYMKRHPWNCVQDWACMLKVGGHLVITAPDQEMYGKMAWPVPYRLDLRWLFSDKSEGGPAASLKMEDVIAPLNDAGLEVIHVRRLNLGWDQDNISKMVASLEADLEFAWEVLAVKRRHLAIRTPVVVRRQNALGDTIAVSAFYNHLAVRHEVIFQTSANHLDYHLGIHATADQSLNADVNLDDYDRVNPYVPLYLLGFHQTGIPLPEKCSPNIYVSADEHAAIQELKSQRYALIDISTISLMSRSVWFDVLEIAEYLDSKGFSIKYIEVCEPRELVCLIGGASLLIGRDSGAIQLAQALETPYVSIMSSVRADARYLPGKMSRTLSSPCPIGEDGCYHRYWMSRDCPVPIDGIAPCGIIETEAIYRAIDEIVEVADARST